jgi:hypothetical protein
MRHVMMVDKVFEQAAAFDVIHFHIDFLHYPLARRSKTPCVTTLHGRLDIPDLRPLHTQFGTHPLVSISNYQRRPLWKANWCGTIYHGLPKSLYRFHERAPRLLRVHRPRVAGEGGGPRDRHRTRLRKALAHRGQGRRRR